MKNEGVKKYLLLFIALFMNMSFFVLGLISIFLLLVMMDGMQDYYMLDILGVTLPWIKLLAGIALVGWSTWLFLGVFLERKLNVRIFPNLLILLTNRSRMRTKSNLLKVLSRKKKLSRDSDENEDNAR